MQAKMQADLRTAQPHAGTANRNAPSRQRCASLDCAPRPPGTMLAGRPRERGSGSEQLNFTNRWTGSTFLLLLFHFLFHPQPFARLITRTVIALLFRLKM